MEKGLREHIEYLLCINIERLTPVSGGDISKAYLLETESERFLCKVNGAPQAASMFEAEKEGLQAIAKTKTLAVPKVLLCESLASGALLLMEYIPSRHARTSDLELLGRGLAQLHQRHGSRFGFDSDNYIGSLPQSNQEHRDWHSFHVVERLLPQLRMGFDSGRLSNSEIPSETVLLKACEKLMSGVRPSLLHGDFWSGNYLVSDTGTPYVIDPATYYGHYEVDLAMTRLFGGFGEVFYKAHAESFPPQPGERDRAELYQLYYLLVHLNLFGSSYYGSVKAILKRYF